MLLTYIDTSAGSIIDYRINHNSIDPPIIETNIIIILSYEVNVYIVSHSGTRTRTFSHSGTRTRTFSHSWIHVHAPLVIHGYR